MKAENKTMEINNSTDLKHAIMQLNYQREEQEVLMRHHLKEIFYSMQLSTVIRRTVNDLSEDTALKSSVVQTGIDLGSGFILDKLLLRKGYGIKSYLLNMGLKKLVSYFASSGKLQKLLAK